MSTLSRWLAPLVIAAGFGTLAFAPTTAHADSGDLVEVLAEVADVMLRGDRQYDNRRYENRRYDNRNVKRRYINSPNHRRGSSHGREGEREVKCDKRGKCKVKTKSTYYDPRYDRKRRGYR